MPLVERDAELATITERWDRARSAGSLLLLGGESGIGKTALVRTFVDGLGGTARVLWGSCDPLATPRPMGPLHDGADDVGGRTRELVLGGAYTHEVFAAMCAELRASSFVFVVDDLQWADEATFDLLRYLLRRIESSRSLIIGTYRDDELGAGHPLRALLGDVARHPQAFRLSLRPLSIAAIETMIGGRPFDAAELLAITGGNCFFVNELLEHDSGELPTTVRDAVLARTANIPARRRETTRANPAGLTARQVEVLRLLGEGLTNAELAGRLYISSKTADHHVSAILAKLGVRNRREAVVAARQLGLTESGTPG